jgi:hypothetical protein
MCFINVKIIRKTLQEVMAETDQNKETQNTKGGPNLKSAGSDDSLEILGVVPAPKDGNLKPAAKVKTKPTTPSLKPPTPKSGNVSGQKRKTCSSNPTNEDSDNDSAVTLSSTTIDILGRDIVG